MSRYIDYDAIDYKSYQLNDKSEEFLKGVVYMAERIEEAPSIDIVFCKECVDFVYDEQYKCYGCATDNGLMGEIKPDDFCSHGERIVQ